MVASSPESVAPDDPETLWQLEKSDRLNAYRLAREQAQSMPEDQRRSFLEPHLAQWEYFLQSRPSNASMSQSSLLQVPSSTSSVSGATGVPVSNVTLTPGRRGSSANCEASRARLHHRLAPLQSPLDRTIPLFPYRSEYWTALMFSGFPKIPQKTAGA